MTQTQTAIPAFMLDAQKQHLEFQKSLFDIGYQGLTTAQEGQAYILEAWTTGNSFLPEESKAQVAEWIGYSKDSREVYKGLVDTSFEQHKRYLDRLAKPKTEPAATAA